MSDDVYGALPPTQQLALEVLAARHRLGEQWWTFDAKAKPVLSRLEVRGWVSVQGGITYGTVRASLTEVGQALMLSGTYVPPILCPPCPEGDAA